MSIFHHHIVLFDALVVALKRLASDKEIRNFLIALESLNRTEKVSMAVDTKI